jgi:hypothetical protein
VVRPLRSPDTELGRLRGEFTAWLVTHGLPSHVDPGALADDAADLVRLAAAAGLTDLRHWTPDHVDAVAAAGEAELTALPLLLGFLADTGRFAGTQEEFDAVLAAAEDAASPVAEIVAELAQVVVDQAVEDPALGTLPVVGRAEAVLRFVAPRRRVTSRGALGRADVVAVLELLGIERDGRPRSMWDVPPLAALWETLEEAELLDISPSNASLTPLAHAWLADEPGAAVTARRRIAEAHLLVLLTEPPEPTWLPDAVDVLLPALAGAALDRALPTEHVPTAPGVRALLDGLAAEGFLQVGRAVTTSPGLRGVLARCTAELLAEELGDPGPPPPDPALAGQAWQLRVELAGAEPAIWREVLVDPNTTLEGLHAVLQRLFAWEDYHLHDYIAVDSRGRTIRFADPEPDGETFGRAPEDETAVRLAQLLAPGRGELVYRYDFGDSWEHLLSVRESRPADGTLPRCTGGAGAAPAEDSGGVWGWRDKVQAATDPAHAEHAEVREWLGLTDGETLDPRAFDRAAVNRRLAVLRGRVSRDGLGDRW